MINYQHILQFFTRHSVSNIPKTKTNQGWKHIELGAANYGMNLNADSTYKAKKINANEQFSLLFQTLDNLIMTKGLEGTIYINDLHDRDVNYCIECTNLYLRQNYPEHQITIASLAGDFFTIDLPKVDSIHLKNPDYFFFERLDDKKNSNRLVYFSEKSREGLTLITYFKSPLIHRLETANVGCKVLPTIFKPYKHIDGNAMHHYGASLHFLILPMNKIRKHEDKKAFITKSSARKKHTYKLGIFFDLSDNNSCISLSKMPSQHSGFTMSL